MQKNRPGSIIVVGWVTILTGIFRFLYVLSQPDYYKSLGAVYNGLDLLIIILIAAIVSIIYLVSGIAILCGKNWGRIGYFIWVGFITVITLRNTNFSGMNITYIFLYCMFVYLLVRPEARKFFKTEKNKDIL